MAIKMLSPEQVRSMSLAEKDEWWLRNVYAGSAPQLTLRSALTGMLLGSVLSLTNLYIAARTGWLLGVGITSVILAFAGWKILAKIGLGREMTLLENNAMQSIATSAGYMSAPLTSSLAAYTMVTNRIVPMHVAFIWMLCLAMLGILFAFPMKKRYINDAQLPFPEGMAAGVLMDSLHRSDPRDGILKAKLLALKRAEERAHLDTLRGDVQASWGDQMRNYVLHPYQMVKDLRTEYESGNTQGVLDGEIDEFIEAGIRWRQGVPAA